MTSLPLMAKNPVRHIFEGKSTKYWDIVYTFDEKYIYQGKSTKYWDIVYTYDDKHIYKGTGERRQAQRHRRAVTEDLSLRPSVTALRSYSLFSS